MGAKKQVFIDGAAGTTGLRIHQRLEARPDIALLVLPDDKRKDLAARALAARQADLSILCLPDEASAQLVEALGNEEGRICDASTAHRTAPGWVYGLPELKGTREKLESATRVAVPGCYASGFNLLAAPLVRGGILNKHAQLYAHALSGYSGAGKAAIAAYQAPDRPAELAAPREYALGLAHKHLPEMRRVSGLQSAPVFSPVICNFYSGMLFNLPVAYAQLEQGYRTAASLAGFYREYYAGEALVTVYQAGQGSEAGFLAANKMAGRDSLELFVYGNAEHALLLARFDNLGKGASGACIQCMNIMLGANETDGLIV